MKTCKRKGCKEPLSDETRRFCAFHVLNWLAWRPSMKKRVQGTGKQG